jgi:uncharacterized protein with beta-barrel porin domain
MTLDNFWIINEGDTLTLNGPLNQDVYIYSPYGNTNLTSLNPDSFDYITQTENSYTETGVGSLDLSVKKSNMIMLRNELGLNFAGCFCFRASKWTVFPKISWVREVRVKEKTLTANFINTDDSFTVTGYFPDRSLVSPGVKLQGSMWDDLLTVSIYYNGQFNGQYSDHNYGAQVRVGF